MTREIALHCMKSYSESHSDLCELCPIYGQTGSDHCFEDALEYVIKDLEQEPRKGHWIVQPSNKEQGERDFIWWKCSKCGQVIFSETAHDRLEFHAFCGRCGADMRGEGV